MADAKRTEAPWLERKWLLREDAVLDAATVLMGDRGYANTTMDEIAEHVGISKPTLYQHFPSKNAIVEAVMLRNIASAEERLVALEAQIARGERARPQLEQHLVQAIGVHQGLWVTRAHIPTSLRDARKLRLRRERIWNRYGRIIDRCKAEGDCRDDIPTMILVQGVVRIFRGDYAELLDNGTLALDTLAQMLVSLLFDGMAPRDSGNGERAEPRAGGVSTAVPRALGVLATVLALAAAVLTPSAFIAAQVPGTPATPAAAEGRPLGLADVLDAALRANPQARAAVAEARVASEELSAARGSWLPTLSFVPNFIVSQSGAGSLNPSTITDSRRQRVTFSPSINLSYLLFDLGGRSGTVGAARQLATAATFSRDVAVQQTVLLAEQAYFSFQSARAVAAAQADNVNTALASRDAAVGRFQAGIATVADTLQASTALAQARVASVAARATLVTARATLATVMGARADVPFRVAEEPVPDAGDVRLATAALSGRIDTLVSHALRLRPDVGAALATTAAANERVRVARSALLPSVQLGATTGQTLANQGALSGSNYNVQVGLAFPFFDAGTRRADLDAARAESDATRARADAVNIDVANAVVTSAEALRLAAEQVSTTDELLASAVSSEDVARGRYTEGVGSIVDLITAQAALAAARSQAAQARWAWATSLSLLARDAGILGPRGQLPVPNSVSLPRTVLPQTRSDPAAVRPPQPLLD